LKAFYLIVSLSIKNSCKLYPFPLEKSITIGLLNFMSVGGGKNEKRSSEAGGHFKSIGSLSGYFSNFTGEGI
jgi:hypothetical protein